MGESSPFSPVAIGAEPRADYVLLVPGADCVIVAAIRATLPKVIACGDDFNAVDIGRTTRVGRPNENLEISYWYRAFKHPQLRRCVATHRTPLSVSDSAIDASNAFDAPRFCMDRGAAGRDVVERVRPCDQTSVGGRGSHCYWPRLDQRLEAPTDYVPVDGKDRKTSGSFLYLSRRPSRCINRITVICKFVVVRMSHIDDHNALVAQHLMERLRFVGVSQVSRIGMSENGCFESLGRCAFQLFFKPPKLPFAEFEIGSAGSGAYVI